MIRDKDKNWIDVMLIAQELIIAKIEGDTGENIEPEPQILKPATDIN